MTLCVERLRDFCVFVCGGCVIFCAWFFCVQSLHAFLVKWLNDFFLVKRLRD